jgi:MFS-type transporter involved in bile tolerance (Atg22 family)
VSVDRLYVQIGTDATVFFGLFGITNRASSLIGPNVVSAIITHTGNSWMGFPFL